jgi:hypothetical protein
MKSIFESFFGLRKLSVRAKTYLTLALLASNAYASILLAQNVSRLFIITFFAGILIFGAYLASIRCPRCGVQVIKNEIHVFGWITHLWSPLPKKRCQYCGYDFKKPELAMKTQNDLDGRVKPGNDS